MKTTLFTIAFGLISPVIFAQHSLEKLWETDTVLTACESVRPDLKAKTLYVSVIGVFDKDGAGSIAKLSPEGKIINLKWVTGLSTPKGMGRFNDLLYVAEQKTVAVIDVKAGKLIKRIAVDGAIMLNDITIDKKGIVYVSDTKTNKVHRIENGVVSLYLDNMKDANGLLAVGNDLYILTGTSMQKADINRKVTQIADGIEGGADGIEMVGQHDFLVSGWEGIIYYVKDDGTKQTILDTRNQKMNSADIGYDPVSKTVYVPMMLNNRVAAYRLK